jgi:serpin B
VAHPLLIVVAEDMTMRLPTMLSLTLVVSSLFAAGLGCSSTTTPDPDPDSDCAAGEGPGCVVASARQRVEPAVSAADVAVVVQGNTAFALDLYRDLAGNPGNLFFSPFSLSESLAMTSAGAHGATAQQMATALHFDLPQDRLHPAFDAIAHALSEPADPGQGADGGAFKLTLASSIWAQEGYPLTLSFLDTLTRNYHAETFVVDFAHDCEGARSAINEWMNQGSGQWIGGLLPASSIPTTTRLVLGNAVHFSAAWKTPFDPVDSQFLPFTRDDGSIAVVPTMTGVQNLRYGEGPDYTALVLPYDAGQLEMMLFLPYERSLDAFVASLTPARLTSIAGAFDKRTVAVTLPTFKVESSLALGGALGRLGMPLAFTDAADFSGISGHAGLSLHELVHQTFVDVDEAGTEAAAASATGFTTTAAYLPAEIHFDHPYLFLVRDGATGTIVFMGRVEDPTL